MKHRMQHTSRWAARWCTLLMLVAFIGLASAESASAQRRPGSIGIGGQIGEPSGLSLKVYHPNRMSYDFLAAWNLDDFFYLNAHGVYERHLGNDPNVHFFYGPGAFFGLRERPRHENDDFEAGISGTVGLGLLIDRLEFYGRVTPRLALTPSTQGDVGGGVGFRFYF